MNPTRIFLIRHAETANPKVFHGAESDIGLSERGVRQTEALAQALADVPLTRVVSSAMLRARLTAEAVVGRLGVPHQVEPDLRERHVSHLSLRSFDHYDNIWGTTVRHWSAGNTAFTHEGAESYDDLQARLLPVWTRLMHDYQGQTFAIVAHGVVCKVLLTTLLPEYGVAGWPRIGPIDNVALTELTHDGTRWHALRINERIAEPAVE